MSKTALKKYLAQLDKPQLEVQITDLYDRFPAVKTYFDFVFNPREDKLIREAKMKLYNEYFPSRRKKPRARRSVAQKYIRHFITLGMDSPLVAELMLYNVETGMAYTRARNVPDNFYKSMLNSFTEALAFISVNDLLTEYQSRIRSFYLKVMESDWQLKEDFTNALDLID